MPSNPERANNGKPHPFERPPQQTNPETIKKIGETAVKGATKDKDKK